MDESKLINKSLMQSITEEILLETRKNNNHTSLNSQLLTIIKDLVVKQSYIERKKNYQILSINMDENASHVMEME